MPCFNKSIIFVSIPTFLKKVLDEVGMALISSKLLFRKISARKARYNPSFFLIKDMFTCCPALLKYFVGDPAFLYFVLMKLESILTSSKIYKVSQIGIPQTIGFRKRDKFNATRDR